MGKFTRTYKIRSIEIGEDYRMLKTFAACYFQECFAEMCASKTLAGYDMQRENLTWLVSDIRIDFTGAPMPFWRDEIEVRVWASAKTPLFLTMDFSLHTKDGVIARGSSNWLVAADKTHKPARLAPHGDKFELVAEKNFADERFAKFEEPTGGALGELERRVAHSEVDFNGHLTNVRYAPTAIEALPIEFLKGRSLEGYRIKFMREAALGETILANAFDSKNGKIFHRITRISDGTLLCAMESFWNKQS